MLTKCISIFTWWSTRYTFSLVENGALVSGGGRTVAHWGTLLPFSHFPHSHPSQLDDPSPFLKKSFAFMFFENGEMVDICKLTWCQLLSDERRLTVDRAVSFFLSSSWGCSCLVVYFHFLSRWHLRYSTINLMGSGPTFTGNGTILVRTYFWGQIWVEILFEAKTSLKMFPIIVLPVLLLICRDGFFSFNRDLNQSNTSASRCHHTSVEYLCRYSIQRATPQLTACVRLFKMQITHWRLCPEAPHISSYLCQVPTVNKTGWRKASKWAALQLHSDMW